MVVVVVDEKVVERDGFESLTDAGKEECRVSGGG